MPNRASASRLTAVALGAFALLGVAERAARACMQPVRTCGGLDFAPAAGNQVPANVGTIVVGPAPYAQAVVQTVELLGPFGEPVAITTEEQSGSILVRPEGPLAPGRHRIVAMAAQPSSCTGASIESSDAGAEEATSAVR